MKRIRIWKRKLIYRFLLFVLPLLIISILVTSMILCWTNYNYFQKTIDQDYRNIIKSSAGEIHLYLENARKGLEGLALVMGATKLDNWQKEMALTSFNHAAVEFMSISLISLEGKEVLSTGREGGDVVFSRDETFRKALSGEDAISGLMRTRENIPYVHMAAPLFHLGRVQEILWAELNIKSVWDVLEGIHVGDTGQVFITDLSGRFIGHRQIDRVVRPLPSARPEMLKKLNESDTLVQWVEEKDAIRFYCVGYHIPGLDWIIILSQAYSEIYTYLYRNIYWAGLITCLICMAAILLGWNRVSHFLRPIQVLHTQVQRIGQGDLDQKVSVDSRDEIGDLGLAFNEMTDSLKRFINRELERARELVHAKNLALLGTTSSKVTHEVGNLLNNLGLTLATLKTEKLSQRGEKTLEIIEKDAGRVREFIRNFLQFAKKPELHLARVPLDGIIREILMVHQSDAEKMGIRLALNWPSGLPPVSVDMRLLYQVFNNLVKNALEAMIDSGSISIEGEVQGEHLLITLEDTGPGIEQDVLEQIFEPFFTTKGKKGTGLGLSIVKTIVEAHRGTIECRSEPKKGTTFIMRLPLQ